MFTGDDYRTFLPFKPGRVYVTSIDGGSVFRGASLTEEQKFNILYRGVHPNQYEVIYINENGDSLSEPPALITPEEIGTAKRNQIDESMPTENSFLQEHSANSDFVSQESKLGNDVDQTQEIADESQSFLQWAEKTFQEDKAFLEFLEKVVRGDIESVADLEKFLAPELPELPMHKQIEKTLREQFTPQRFDRAITTLQKYGIQDGLRRIRKTDSEIAAYLERTLLPQFPRESRTEED